MHGYVAPHLDNILECTIVISYWLTLVGIIILLSGTLFLGNTQDIYTHKFTFTLCLNHSLTLVTM